MVPSTELAFKPLVVKFLCSGSVRRPYTDRCHYVLSLGSATRLQKEGKRGNWSGKIFVHKCMFNKCQACYDMPSDSGLAEPPGDWHFPAGFSWRLFKEVLC